MTVITIEHQPDRCPECRLENLEIGETVNEFNGITEAVECKDCGLQWVNYYTYDKTEISTVTNIPEGYTLVHNDNIQRWKDYARILDHYGNVKICKGGRAVHDGFICPHCDSVDPSEECHAPLEKHK